LVQNRKARMPAVHCMPDCTHLFVGFKPDISIPDFIKEIKAETNFIYQQQQLVKSNFARQGGYGVFSYSHSNIDSVIKYILNQEEHHKKKTFKQEYHQFLEKFGIAYEEKYLFEFFDQ
jgi:putative transposase